MKKALVRSIMFISSYLPLYLFLLILQYKYYKKGINEFIEQKAGIDTTIICFLLLMSFFILVSLISVILIVKIDENNSNFNIVNPKRASDDIISYVFTYIVPILSFSLEDKALLIVNSLLFLMIWYLYLKLNLLYLNPLWAVFGYISYETENGYVVTDISFNNIKRKENKVLYGYYLANGIFLAKQKNNK